MAAMAITKERGVLRRRAGPAALLSVTAAIAFLATTPQIALAGAAQKPAFPAHPAAGPIISGYKSAMCIDDPGDSAKNDTLAVIADCNGSAGQDWTIETDGTIQINGKCLDIYREEKTSKAPVEIWTCTGRANQQWRAFNGSLLNPVSGKCLDDPRFSTTNGTALILYTCNGGRNQQWEPF
jgi:Ricin-type beta-trefoil lectin domain